MLKKLKSIFNAYVALALLPFIKKKQNLWLIGGHNGKLYTDNAKVFYEYTLDKHPHIDIYWVVDKNATCLKQIKGNTLMKGSVKAYMYFYRAEVTLFSDTLNSDIAPFSFILPLVKTYYNRTFKVYLSHGTIAFKKMPKYTGKLATIKNAIFNSYNLAVASTDLAAKSMLNYHIAQEAIEILGSARHDVLTRLSSRKRTLLVAPTWRGWLTNLPSLEKSDFYHHYTLLLSDKKLISYFRKNEITLNFYLHHMFHKYLDEFKVFENDCIKILPSSVDIGHEIMTAQLMITDYSSMCSDFYYLQKPVLFFQFDKEEFMLKTGSEIDLNKDVFGEVSTDSHILVEQVLKTMDNPTRLSSKQKEGEKYFMHFTDKKNCHRIYEAIQIRLKKHLI